MELKIDISDNLDIVLKVMGSYGFGYIYGKEYGINSFEDNAIN
jgi:hypothetical protein